MKKNTDLLSEELKRHKRLVEYTFFMEDDDLDTDKPKDDRKILLGMKNEADPEMDPAAPDAEAPEGGAPAGPDAGAEGGEAPVDMQVADEPQADPNAGAQGMGGDAGAADPANTELPPDPNAGMEEEPPTDEVDDKYLIMDETKRVNCAGDE